MRELKALEEKFTKLSMNSESCLAELLHQSLPMEREMVIGKGALYNLRPYEIERAGFKLGKKLKEIPEKPKNIYIYHFDDKGRIVRIEICGQSASVVSNEFYTYCEDRIERLHFTSAGKLRNISWIFTSGGVVSSDFNWGMYGCSASLYTYSDELLEMIHVQQKEHIDPCFSDFKVLFRYDGDALISIFNIFPNGYQEQRYP